MNTQEHDATTSPLKWAGSKRWLLPRLLEIYATYRDRTLVEPFVGSMAVALGLRPARAHLGDVNPHLVNFYARLRDVRPFEIKMENDEAMYYAYRNCFNDLITTSARHTRIAGELFYYLNRTGFNGLCRFSKAGNFNVPFGKYETINYGRDFSHFAQIMSGWEISCRGFEQTPLSDGDFVYLDPPYDGTFTDYSMGGFTWNQQIELAIMFSRHKGPVIASNQATDRVIALYKNLGFVVEKVLAPRAISSNGDRTPAMEMLAMKNV